MTKLNKEGWEYKKLGEVCEPKKNILRASSMFGAEDEIAYIDISSIDNSAFRLTEITSYLFSEAPSRAQQVVTKDDIIVSLVRPNLKNIAMVNKDEDNLVASSGFCVVRAIGTVSHKYLYHLCISTPFTKFLCNRVSGANYPAVRESDIREYPINLPPLPIQQRIVEELDEINAIISAKKLQLSKLDELAQSIFYNMFGDPIANEKGWEVKKLGEVTEVQNGFAFKSELFTEKGLPILRISNIQNNEITEDGCVYFEERSYNTDLSRYLVEPNRILIAMSGATTGKCGINKTSTHFYLNQRVGMFRENKEMVQTLYLFYFLLMKSEESLKIAMGVAQPNLSTSQIKDFNIPLPPLPLQETFAARVSAIEEQKSSIAASIEKMQTLLDARMQEYFG